MKTKQERLLEDGLFSRHLALIESPDARAAYQFLANFFATREDVTACTPKGDAREQKKSVTITIRGQKYFSFIANQKDLLFYFRFTESNPFISRLKELKGLGFVVKEHPNSANEATVRIRNEKDARELTKTLFGV